MATSFLDHLRQHGIDLASFGGGGAAAQGLKPAGGSPAQRAWDFAFATGIECSNPVITDANGNRLRRNLLEECGHLQRFRDDLQLVKQLGTPCLRYGLPNHLVHLGPDRFDWSFPDEAMAEIHRLGITPIVDLLHFGIPDWM